MSAYRVLLVDHESVLGGAELSMVGLAEAMPVEKVNYTAAIAGPGEFKNALERAGIEKISFLPMQGWRWWETGTGKRIKLLLSLPFQLINIVKWYRFYRTTRPDIIHFNLTHLVEPVIAAALSGIPTVMHFREAKENNFSFFGGLPLLFKLMNLTDLWVANSEVTYRHILPYAQQGKIIHTIPNGIDLSKYTSGTAQQDKITNTFTVAKIAGLVSWKNHLLFFELAKMVLERGYNIVFLVAGKGSDEYTKTMHSIVDELGLSTHVKFTGFIDNMSDFLANVDLVVHTSGKESFGRVYVESMAAGKPILAIKGTAEEEIIGTDEGGFTYSVNELHLMADKICELADNREESRRIGRKGKERAEKLYSISAHVQKIYVTYSLLINRNKIM